ncbi:MAG TPA: hypothetical protein VF659_17070 [Pyrinomonadaceae bacterium]|jgi:hypothetical protein
MPENRKWVITTSGDRPLKEVKKKLVEKGFAIGEVLDAIGCITGEATEAVAEKVRAVPGVADVSPEPPTIYIGPPDAPVS